MNIFIIDKSYVIKKIKSVAGGWKLYPQDKNEKEIFISKQYYAGKMPFCIIVVRVRPLQIW